MAKKSLAELSALLLNPTTAPGDLAPYFISDPNAATPFSAGLAFNPETVDIGDIDISDQRSAGLLSLANTAERWKRRFAFEQRLADNQYHGPIIVSEGDSWFQFPILLKDTIDWLSEDLAILSLDAAGDTMVNMEQQSEFLAPIGKYGASILLFSAGGNDLLASGSLAKHIGRYQPGASAASLLLPSFDALINSVLLGYRRIFTKVTSTYPNISVIVHGYDNVIPRAGGKWLGSYLNAANIQDQMLQNAVVAEMMARFNTGLGRLAEQFSNVHYLDLRGVVKGRWHDELHPTNEGYHDVANQFRAAIEAITARPRGAQIGASKTAPEAGRGATTPSSPRGLSLHVGINAINPAYYRGEFANLTAAEFDAQDMASLAKAAGFSSSKLLLGQAATRTAVMDGFAALATDAKPGDLVLITYAGHGSQLPDYSGDEDQGADETWCLYDDQLVDDEIWKMFAAFKAGVRILMLSDSCHSGTIARSLAGAIVRGPAQIKDTPPQDRARTLPPEIAALTYRAHADELDARQAELAAQGFSKRGAESALPVAASIRLISGCTDAQSSFDGVANGHFTEKLKRIWARGAFTGNYAAFHAEIRRNMRADQTPEHRTYGPADPVFDAQRPFEI